MATTTRTTDLTSTDRPSPSRRLFDPSYETTDRGSTYVRTIECGHLVALIQTAYGEAEACARNAERADTEQHCRALLEDALVCASTAEHYTHMLLDILHPDRLTEVPPAS